MQNLMIFSPSQISHRMLVDLILSLEVLLVAANSFRSICIDPEDLANSFLKLFLNYSWLLEKNRVATAWSSLISPIKPFTLTVVHCSGSATSIKRGFGTSKLYLTFEKPHKLYATVDMSSIVLGVVK